MGRKNKNCWKREISQNLREFGFSFQVELTYRVVSVILGSVGMVWVVVVRFFGLVQLMFLLLELLCVKVQSIVCLNIGLVALSEMIELRRALLHSNIVLM
jgi:hypothetical protein